MTTETIRVPQKDDSTISTHLVVDSSRTGFAIQIRSMQRADLEQVQAIDQISFTLPWPASAYRYELEENEASRLWVAETTDAQGHPTIIGIIIIWLILDEAHVATIAVHPDYRHRGVAQQLLVVAMQDAVRLGALQATLEVRAGNWVAQKLYHRFQFEVVGRRIRYYRDNNEDALIMTTRKLSEIVPQIESTVSPRSDPLEG